MRAEGGSPKKEPAKDDTSYAYAYDNTHDLTHAIDKLFDDSPSVDSLPMTS